MEGDAPGLDPAIEVFYAQYPEEGRLSQGWFQIEAERTRLLVSRYCPPPPAVWLDVGGGAGAHAFWLASLGYQVHLVDPVDRLVQAAKERSLSASDPLASAEVGDARNLAFPDASVDCILMLGPLYHLTTRADRDRALDEAARVLRSDGLLFAAGITRWASLFDGLTHDYLADPTFVAVMEGDVETGQHRNPNRQPQYFTTAYFHTPEEFCMELAASGLELEGVFGLEGPAPLLADFDERWADLRTRTDLLRAAELIESEPSLLGLSPHILGVCRKL
ncbi:MAG: class I SAM-dependent methyltransferase [Gemmatimonadota bacterium]